MKLEEFSGSDDHLIVKGKRTKRPRPSLSASSTGDLSPATEEDEDMAHCLILLARGKLPETKFTTRKFAEMSAAGIFVYECKTCNRSFPSFQALGGHRASHKKPKTTPDDDHRNPPQVEKGQPDQDRAKIHECGICGSEFGSGQALGGHMRRHRPAASRINASSTDNETSSHGGEHRNVFVLDLNLPAPPEEENFAAERLVFSAVALVDCHY